VQAKTRDNYYAIRSSVPGYYSEVSNDATSAIFKDANSGGTFTTAIVSDFPATATLDDAGAALQD